MRDKVRRILVEKKKGFDIEAVAMLGDLRENLGVKDLKSVRILNRYDISGVSDDEYNLSKGTIFSEPQVDDVFDETADTGSGRVFAVEYLPGQYDQRADSAAQCIQILTQGERPDIRTAKVIVLEGCISEGEFKKIKSYIINPIDSREASLGKPMSLDMQMESPQSISIIEGFIDMDSQRLQKLRREMGLAMEEDDLSFCQVYFRDSEKRNPSITEIRVIDTYWSDHCRHTTFNTIINEVSIDDGKYHDIIREAYESYLKTGDHIHKDKIKQTTLMDIATSAVKELRLSGMLPDLDVSDEINACSICADVDVNGENQKWLIMFKNETHNHPTEIEPFGGAATCLGGAIRDPLSGRAYVYQAMRVTGSGDPRRKIEDTLPGKLPQRKITTVAAAGYSSYGNQVGLATGHVCEIYDEGYVAKRMEIGAVLGAVPLKNVVRKCPEDGDRIVLLGGRTGRDGCGGATGSSKEHDEESLLNCGAEVQKGNPPTERKLQRLFRNPAASTLIKRCNDFGAGGVSVAVGELAEGMIIDLDAVPKKYEGLDGTELAISESQERMAVVLCSDDVETFITLAREENLEAVEVACVTSDRRVRMKWNGNIIVDISRDFLDTNGVRQMVKARITSPAGTGVFETSKRKTSSLKELWLKKLGELNVCSQRGLVERFDSTIGAGTVFMPFGGRHQMTPSQVMAAKIPVLSGDTTTGTVMSFGYDPAISRWSPFHGAVYAVVDAVTKIVSCGGDYRNARLTLQEYYERLNRDPVKWGKPLSALLGAYYVQMKLNIPAIGGKDSMSGTFKDLNVPPTLVAFAVNVIKVDKIISPEFKKVGSTVAIVRSMRDENDLPDFERLERNYSCVNTLIDSGMALSSYAVGEGGCAAALSKMTFGNSIGIQMDSSIDEEELFIPGYGSIILELRGDIDIERALKDVEYTVLGHTTDNPVICIGNLSISINEAKEYWEKPLESVFPTRISDCEDNISEIRYEKRTERQILSAAVKPKVYIPVFPGTNCEYDTAKEFENAGGDVDIQVFRNLSQNEIEDSIKEMVRRIKSSQIIALPGGFSCGDEPDGSGKFIAAVFRSPQVMEAVMELLQKRDGLMIGICNGFQALVKLGLLPYGEIRDMKESSPTLTFNKIGRHMSRMVTTKVVSVMSPWFSKVNVGDIHTIAVSHGEGRFIAGNADLHNMIKNGQIATQYVDLNGNPSTDIMYNPNGSVFAIEGITSPDGRVLGKMGHSERIGNGVYINVPGEKDQKIFQSGIGYFMF